MKQIEKKQILDLLDKPLKYPSLFSSSKYLLINKVDLIPYTNFNLEKAVKNALSVNQELKIIKTSCTDGTGMKEWAEVCCNFRHERPTGYSRGSPP